MRCLITDHNSFTIKVLEGLLHLLNEELDRCCFVLGAFGHRIHSGSGDLIGVCLGEVERKEKCIGGGACGVLDGDGNFTPAALYCDDVTILDVFSLGILRIDLQKIA